MARNHPQRGPGLARETPAEQCPSCPPGGSQPVVAGEKTCWRHSWWNADNGAASNLEE